MQISLVDKNLTQISKKIYNWASFMSLETIRLSCSYYIKIQAGVDFWSQKGGDMGEWRRGKTK